MDDRYGVIACCVDRDEMAGAVVREGIRLADGDPERVLIVHAVSPAGAPGLGGSAAPTPARDARGGGAAWLAEVAAAHRRTQPVLLEGRPVRAVTDWVTANGIDLIVAGAGRGPGGFASQLAVDAPCALHLVRTPSPEDGAVTVEAAARR